MERSLRETGPCALRDGRRGGREEEEEEGGKTFISKYSLRGHIPPAHGCTHMHVVNMLTRWDMVQPPWQQYHHKTLSFMEQRRDEIIQLSPYWITG